MLSISFRLAIALALMISLSPWHGARAKAPGKVYESMILSTGWLAKHLKDDSLVLLEQSKRSAGGEISGRENR